MYLCVPVLSVMTTVLGTCSHQALIVCTCMVSRQLEPVLSAFTSFHCIVKLVLN